jgi:hypothetical protein
MQIKVVPSLPVAIPVTDVRKSWHMRTIKTPYDPHGNRQSPFLTAVAAAALAAVAALAVGPPQSARIMVQRDNIQSMLSQAAVCRKCKKGELFFGTKDIGAASLPEMKYSKCQHSVTAELTLASYHDKKLKQKALTDYSLNVLCVLGFLTAGDGGSEMQ